MMSFFARMDPEMGFLLLGLGPMCGALICGILMLVIPLDFLGFLMTICD